MRECRTYGSVRGVGGNAHPYRDSVGALEHQAAGNATDDQAPHLFSPALSEGKS